MKEYVFSLLVISAITSVGSQLLYKEGDKSYRFATGVILAYVAIIPIPGLISSFDINDYMPDFNAEDGEYEYEAVAEQAFCDGIRNAVCQEFSVSDEYITVNTVGFDFKEMRADKIVIFFNGKGIFKDIEKIEKYVRGLGYGDCEVEIEL